MNSVGGNQPDQHSGSVHAGTGQLSLWTDRAETTAKRVRWGDEEKDGEKEYEEMEEERDGERWEMMEDWNKRRKKIEVDVLRNKEKQRRTKTQ